jgi:GNAT superfamily N-acetyltransferase
MIDYVEIDNELEAKIIAKFGQWVKDFGCIHYGDGCYSLAAVCKSEPIGFISLYPENYPAPLQSYRDAFIDDIEVIAEYRRQGIASKLLMMAEEWSRRSGYSPIRSWSSDDTSEAIPMWYKHKYGVCPAIMRGESLIPDFAGKPIYGFYVAKVL